MFANLSLADLAWLLPIAFGVGALIGAVGIGGILLIPALTVFAALPIQSAMATALFTFTFTGIVGTVMFQRRGSIDWSLARPVLSRLFSWRLASYPPEELDHLQFLCAVDGHRWKHETSWVPAHSLKETIRAVLGE